MRNSVDDYRQYSMIMEWSDEDNAYIVTVPELSGCRTHGATREEAIRHGEEVIESWIDANRAWGRPIPPPNLFVFPEEEAELEDVRAEAS